MGHSYCLLSDSYRHRYMGQSETQKRQQPFSRRAFPEVASHRFLHVGNQCGPLHADSLSQCRIHHRHRFGQLCLVCVCFHLLAGFCLCPPLFGSAYHHLAGVHGAAFRTVHPQHSCLVHHCDDPYLVACPDLIRRRYPYPSGFRYSHVAIGIDPARYLRILHHGRRAESGSLYQCIPKCFCLFSYRPRLL